MSDYRVYFMNDGGRIQDALEFECDDDEAALDYIAEKLDGRAVELWSGARVVAKIPETGN